MDEKHIRTLLEHTGEAQTARRVAASVSAPKVLPIYMDSVFSFDDVPSLDAVYAGTAQGYVYSRNGNPNTEAAGEILAAAEGAAGALTFASGMAAITMAILANVQSGDHIVASGVLYGGVYDFFRHELPRFGVAVSFADFNDLTAVEAALQSNTRLLYTETISNPTMEVTDLPAAAALAHRHGCKLMVDNTFATAAVAKPLALGADITVYSATKYLGGHSDLIGGAVAANSEDELRALRRCSALYGAIMSPFDAWLLSRSLRTLDLRVEQHSRNALQVARFLENHPKVEQVYYPGLDSSPYKPLADALFIEGRCGGMLSADIAGGEAGASALIKACQTIKFVPSLAGVSTTISYPAKTSHRAYSPEELAAAGISLGQLRFSIGLEDAGDIIAELAKALESV